MAVAIQKLHYSAGLHDKVLESPNNERGPSLFYILCLPQFFHISHIPNFDSIDKKKKKKKKVSFDATSTYLVTPSVTYHKGSEWRIWRTNFYIDEVIPKLASQMDKMKNSKDVNEAKASFSFAPRKTIIM